MIAYRKTRLPVFFNQGNFNLRVRTIVIRTIFQGVFDEIFNHANDLVTIPRNRQLCRNVNLKPDIDFFCYGRKRIDTLANDI